MRAFQHLPCLRAAAGYSVTGAVVNGERKVWIESIPLLASGAKGRGK